MLAFAFFATTASGSTPRRRQAYVQLYGLMAFMGVVLILFIQALVSVAIWNYFRTHHPGEHRMWNHTIAPLISVIGQLAVLAVAIDKIDFLGAGYTYAWYLVVDRRVRVRRRHRIRAVPEIERPRQVRDDRPDGARGALAPMTAGGASATRGRPSRV